MTERAMTSAPPADVAEGGVLVRHRVPGFSDRWLLPEGTVPEAPLHYDSADELRRVLLAWVARTSRNASVFRNLAIRPDPKRRRVGYDPDVCVVEPAVSDPYAMGSLKLWEGFSLPLVVEVVSASHPTKDYREVAAGRLHVASDRAGTERWLTGEGAEVETERAAKEAALRRVAELEAELSRSR